MPPVLCNIGGLGEFGEKNYQYIFDDDLFALIFYPRRKTQSSKTEQRIEVE